MLVTYWSVDFTLLFEYPYFFRRTNIRRRIRLSAAAWSLVEANYRQSRADGLSAMTELVY